MNKELSAIRSEVVALYLGERLSVAGVQKRLLERGYSFTFHQVAYFIKKLGIAVRGHHAAKSCVLCKEDYSPNNANQQICDVCAPDIKSQSIAWTYGLSYVRHQEMLKKQNNSCAICTQSFAELSSRQIHIDHDHLTGYVRGILCNSCNIRIAGFDDQKWVTRAQEYLREAHSHTPE